MAARFYSGASLKATRTISSQNPKTGQQGRGMKAGIPGFIKTGQDASQGGLTNSTGIGPHKPGPVGQKGGAHRANKQSGRGSTDKSYRATSTGPAGKIVRSGKMESLRGHALTSSERR